MVKSLLTATVLMMSISAHALSARSYVIMDMDGQVIASKNPDEIQPIASITKLVTVSRNVGQDPTELLTVTREDIRNANNGRHSPLRAGMQLTRDQLFDLALVTSDNVAAVILGRQEFSHVDLPPNTQIVEASGLDPNNTSTAMDIAEMARGMYNTEIATRSVQPAVLWRKKSLHSTNPLIEAQGWTFHLSKTGYIRLSGGCLVVITEWASQVVTVVILGSKDTRSRWMDLYELRKQYDTEMAFAAPSWYRPTKYRAKSKSPKKHRRQAQGG
jgi:D-alanyl-D-alanine endopeptidase (penicillin-binding protein 7)